MPALVEAAGDVPIEMQCHNTTGVAGYNYLIGVESGDPHPAHRARSDGQRPVAALDRADHREPAAGRATPRRVDLERVRRISEHLRQVAEQEGHPIGVPNEYNVFPYHHQLPGGMTGTLKAQLAQYDMSDRFEEVLEEIVRVREELGHPISATPFSQLMGIQAVLNVVTGERYGTVPDEVLVYVLGHLGDAAGADRPERPRPHARPRRRGKEIQEWTPPQPTIEELKEQYGDRSMTDEELLRRYLVPLPDVEATHAAGPAPRDFHFEADGVPTSLVARPAAVLARDVRPGRDRVGDHHAAPLGRDRPSPVGSAGPSVRAAWKTSRLPAAAAMASPTLVSIGGPIWALLIYPWVRPLCRSGAALGSGAAASAATTVPRFWGAADDGLCSFAAVERGVDRGRRFCRAAPRTEVSGFGDRSPLSPSP